MANFEGVCVKTAQGGNGHQSFLRDMRRKVQLSAENLAARVGTTRNKIKTIEQKTWRKVSLGDIETLAPAFNMRPEELFFCIFVSQQPPFSRTHQAKPFFSIDFESGIRISSLTPKNPSCFIGQIRIPPKTTLPKCLSPAGEIVFYRVERKGELLVSFLKKECVLKEGECLSLNGSIPHELYNPTLHDIEATIMTLPSFLKAGEKEYIVNGDDLPRSNGKSSGNGKHE